MRSTTACAAARKSSAGMSPRPVNCASLGASAPVACSSVVTRGVYRRTRRDLAAEGLPLGPYPQEDSFVRRATPDNRGYVETAVSDARPGLRQLASLRPA